MMSSHACACAVPLRELVPNQIRIASQPLLKLVIADDYLQYRRKIHARTGRLDKDIHFTERQLLVLFLSWPHHETKQACSDGMRAKSVRGSFTWSKGIELPDD